MTHAVPYDSDLAFIHAPSMEETEARISGGKGLDVLGVLRTQFDKQQRTRRIVTFRKTGNVSRRREETHRQQLYRGTTLAGILRDVGFRVRLVRSYGAYRLADHLVGVVARTPGSDPAR